MATSVLCTLVAAGPRRIVTANLREDEADECLQHWWVRVTSLLGQLHGRIIRSLHLAILLSRLSPIEMESDKRFAALLRRLVGLLSEPLFQRNRAEVLRLVDQLLMDTGENRHEFAGAVLSCLGITPPAHARRLKDDTTDPVTLIQQFARLCSPFANPTRNEERHYGQDAALAENLAYYLNEVLAACQRQSWDMVVLGELAPIQVPRVEKGVGRSI
jgi:hypothetical protein